jgi:hypothetical protein
MRDRLGVRWRLYLAFLGISAFAVLAAGAAIYSFGEVGKALERITQDRVPSALASLEISRQAERIVAVAPTLLAVTTPAQHAQVSQTVAGEVRHLNQLLNELKDSGMAGAALGSIETTVARVNTNLTALDALVADYLEAGERKVELLRQLSTTHIATRRLLAPGLLVMEAELSQLGRTLDDPNLSGKQRTEIMTRLVQSIASSPPLQRAQLEALTINDTLVQAASAPQPDDPIPRCLAPDGGRPGSCAEDPHFGTSCGVARLDRRSRQHLWGAQTRAGIDRRGRTAAGRKRRAVASIDCGSGPTRRQGRA